MGELEEKEVECQPKIVACTGEHEHYWSADWDIEDDEYHRQHVICTVPNCWLGKYFDPLTHKLENGKIIKR